MGFYDFRCMITGVSLHGAGAVAVLLAPFADGYRPLCLGIGGSYDRFGSIDCIEEDHNTETVLAYFVDRARDGRLVLDADYEPDYGNPPDDLDCLLRYFERNGSDSSEESAPATLDGQRIFSTLIARQVWDAIAATAPDTADPAVRFEHLFDGAPVATEIYRGRIPRLTRHIHELSAVDGFLTARGLNWALQDEDELGAQHYGAEMRTFLAAAERAFDDVPAIRSALASYAEEVRDLLEDD